MRWDVTLGGRVMAGALAVGVLAVASLAGAVRGDTIYLSDGTWIVGRVVKETADELEVDGKTNTGIVYQGKLSRSRVSSVLKSEAPGSGSPEPEKKGPEEKKEPARAKEPAGDFLVVPMKGVFGEDIVPKGVDVALDWAVSKGVKQVVFTIDSPGGQVWAAEAIRAIIKEHAGKVSCHVVIQRAMSASIWVVFACEKIGALPGSTLGAAVAFTRDSSGNASVDEKFNSAMAARIASEADRLGHPGELARSMILPDQRLYAVKKGEAWAFVHDRPEGGEVETLNEGNRVVTLTSEQMLRFGVASRVEKGDEGAIAEMLGDARLKGSGGMGETSMRNAAAATKALRKSIDNWAESVLAAEKLWQRALEDNSIEGAIQASDDYLKQLRRVGALKNSAKDLGMLEYPVFARIDVAGEVKKAEDNLLKLKELRRKRDGR